jgi:type I restriction enzyme M protein
MVMIAIRTNFFYTRTVPCELWHFDRNKPEDRRDQVLMLDARNIYRKVTRKIYDFTPEQQANLAAIVWLYRGQTDRFVGLVQSYLDRTITEAAVITEYAAAFEKALPALPTQGAAPFLKISGRPSRSQAEERDEAAEACFASLKQWTARISKKWTKPCLAEPGEPALPPLGTRRSCATACRDLVKDVDLVAKFLLALDRCLREGSQSRQAKRRR